MTRWIAHVDMDSFYVSVERLKNPRLEGLPVVVGGLGPRAVVASSSYEARKFGVRSAMPMAQARRLCAQLVIVEPDFKTYSTLSSRVFDELRSLAPIVEQVSIDEAYLDFTGCERIYPNRVVSGTKIKEVVKKVSGLKCTVGIATNKLIAKMASDLAKPDGLRIVTGGSERDFLKTLSIRKIPGVGPKTALKLESLGIQTCDDLANAEPSRLKTYVGDHALGLQEYARGVDHSVVTSESERKSFSAEETFESDIDSLEILQDYAKQMSEDLATLLRADKLLARTIQIKMRLSDFTTMVRAHTLPQGSSLSSEIYSCAMHLLATHKPSGKELRLFGVSVRNLVKEEQTPVQFDLFENQDLRQKKQKVELVKDQLKQKWGQKILK